MATLEKRGDQHRIVFWIHGERFSRSLKTSNKKTARAALARLEDNLSRYEQGLLSPPDNADIVTFLLSDGKANGKPSPPPIRTLDELLNDYFDNIPQASIEATTIAGMKIHASHLRRPLRRNFPIRSLQAADLQRYIDGRAEDKGLRGRSVSPATIKKDIVTLRTVWNWPANMDLVQRPFPNCGLRYPKTDEKPPFLTFAEVEKRIKRGGLTPAAEADLWDRAFLTLPDVDELLRHVKSTARQGFVYPMFVFAAHTGARRSEMLRALVDDVDFVSAVIHIREKKRVKGTNSRRRVPLSPLLRTVLSAWTDDHPGGQSLFCLDQDVPRSKKERSALEPLTRDEAHDHFRRTLAGTKWARLRGWHVFRHSFCSNSAACGIDQRLISAWVGHMSQEMEARYRHLVPSQEQEAIARVFS